MSYHKANNSYRLNQYKTRKEKQGFQPGTSKSCKIFDILSLIQSLLQSGACISVEAKMVKLTVDLIEGAGQYINPIRDRELDLRFYQLP